VASGNSKIYKVAGLSLIGFCAVSMGMDRANVGPLASQVAGFCGAFIGALVAQKRARPNGRPREDEPEKPRALKQLIYIWNLGKGFLWIGGPSSRRPPPPF